MALSISPAAKAKLVERGMDFKYGARPLKRAIRKLVEDEIAEHLLQGNSDTAIPFMSRRLPTGWNL